MAHKEAKTKPLNATLKAIRADYKPLEEQLKQAIASIRSSITTYATNQAKIALQLEQSILNDKRTKLTTKVQQLAEIEQPQAKVSTEQGSVTLTTVKKYSISDPVHADHLADLYRKNILVLDLTALRAHMKNTGGVVPEGITVTEEQSLRNYR
jgi:hypothetical protein